MKNRKSLLTLVIGIFVCQLYAQNTYQKIVSTALPSSNAKVKAVYASPTNDVLILEEGNSLKQYNRTKKNWTNVPIRTSSIEDVAYLSPANYAVLTTGGIVTAYYGNKPILTEGKAIDITAGLDYRLYKIDAATSKIMYVEGVYQDGWRIFESQPNFKPVKIAVSKQKNPWVLDEKGNIYRHLSGKWHNVTGLALDITITKDNEVYIRTRSPQGVIGGGNKIAKYDFKNKRWNAERYGLGGSIASGGLQNSLYYTDLNNEVFYQEDKEIPYAISSIDMGNDALKIFANDQQQLMKITRNHEIYVYAHDSKTWSKAKSGGAVKITNKPVDIALIHQVKYAVLDSEGQVFEVAGDHPKLLPGKAIDITAGLDKNIYKIDQRDRKIYYYGGLFKNWIPFPAQPNTAVFNPVKIAVSKRGNPWLVSDQGIIWRHLNGKWVYVKGKASDLTISIHDEVYKLSDKALVTGIRTIGKYDFKEQEWDEIYGTGRSIAHMDEKSSYLVADGNYKIQQNRMWLVSNFCTDANVCPEIFNAVFEVDIRSYVPPRFQVFGNDSYQVFVATANNDYVKPGCRYSISEMKSKLRNDMDLLDEFAELSELILTQWSTFYENAKLFIASNLAEGICETLADNQGCREDLTAVLKSTINGALVAIGIPPEIPNIQQLREHGIEYLAAEIASQAVSGVDKALTDVVSPELRRNLMSQAYDIAKETMEDQLDKLAPSLEYNEDDPKTWGYVAPCYAPHNAQLYVSLSIKDRKAYEVLLSSNIEDWPILQVSDDKNIYAPLQKVPLPRYLEKNKVIIPLTLHPYTDNQPAITTGKYAKEKEPAIPGEKISQSWLNDKFGIGDIHNYQRNIELAKRQGEYSDWDLFYIDSNKTTMEVNAVYPFLKKSVSENLAKIQNHSVGNVWDSKTGEGVLKSTQLTGMPNKVLLDYYGRINPPNRCNGEKNIEWIRY